MRDLTLLSQQQIAHDLPRLSARLLEDLTP
jgi:hypothetical protein